MNFYTLKLIFKIVRLIVKFLANTLFGDYNIHWVFAKRAEVVNLILSQNLLIAITMHLMSTGSEREQYIFGIKVHPAMEIGKMYKSNIVNYLSKLILSAKTTNLFFSCFLLLDLCINEQLLVFINLLFQ